MRMRSFYFFNRDEIHKYKGFYIYPNIYITMKPIIEPFFFFFLRITHYRTWYKNYHTWKNKIKNIKIMKLFLAILFLLIIGQTL